MMIKFIYKLTNKLINLLFYINDYMILNLSYNYLYNENEKEILGMVIMNTKLYLISISFYFILYLIIVLIKNNTIKKILYVIFITDLIGLIINIIGNLLPNEYSLIKSIKKKISLYKEK
jgi:hypothetical protein